MTVWARLCLALCFVLPAAAVLSSESAASRDEDKKELSLLVNVWNELRNAADKEQFIELYRASDREAVRESTLGDRPAKATISVREIAFDGEASARISFERQWGGKDGRRVLQALPAVRENGRWALVFENQRGRVSTSSAVARKVEAPSASKLAVTKEFVPEPLLSKLTVSAGKALPVRWPQDIRSVQVADPDIADIILVGRKDFAIVGSFIGKTNVLIWPQAGAVRILEVEVNADVEPLRNSIALAFPKERDIRVSSAFGSVVLQGEVSNTLVADGVAKLARAYLSNYERYLNRREQRGARTEDARIEEGATTVRTAVGGEETGVRKPGYGLINDLKIRDPQQVMLEVRIAEVSKELLERLGFKFSTLSGAAGITERNNIVQVPGQTISEEIFTGTTTTVVSGDPPVTTTTVSPFTRTLTNSAGEPTFVQGPPLTTTTFPSNLISVDPAIGALSYLLSGRKGQLLEVDAQKRDQLVKILAEPTIVAVSGKPGSFVSGGKVYLPVPAVSGSSPTLQETEFGIRLNFLPTVLDNGRINLKVEPEVSEPISFQTNLAFSLRKVSSTVELKDGETLVIGGLLKNNVEEAISRLPILGDIPILGALFRSSEFKNNRSELVVVVSPSLVKATTSMPTLPTDNFVPPTRSEFFLEGKMEGSATQSEGSNADR
jgi:pilus assembly protein CpaC